MGMEILGNKKLVGVDVHVLVVIVDDVVGVAVATEKLGYPLLLAGIEGAARHSCNGRMWLGCPGRLTSRSSSGRCPSPTPC